MLLLLLACAPVEEAPSVPEGTYTFTPEDGGSGSCGPDYADIFFVTTTPTDVVVTATADGWDGQDQSRTGDGLGSLSCVGFEDYECDLYDGSEAAADIDATTTSLANAEGRFIGEDTLEGTWTLSSSCTGADCGTIATSYGAEFPCTWTQPFTAARE